MLTIYSQRGLVDGNPSTYDARYHRSRLATSSYQEQCGAGGGSGASVFDHEAKSVHASCLESTTVTAVQLGKAYRAENK